MPTAYLATHIYEVGYLTKRNDYQRNLILQMEKLLFQTVERLIVRQNVVVYLNPEKVIETSSRSYR